MRIGERVHKVSKWLPVENFEVFEHFSGPGIIIGKSHGKYIVEWGRFSDGNELFLSIENDVSIMRAADIEHLESNGIVLK